MIPKECKRLAEVDFPLSAVNDACVRENNKKTRVDSGHISLLHSWWARRPLASCRAMLLTLLLPDPADPLCPKSFKEAARKELKQFRRVGPMDTDLRQALLASVAELGDWDLVGKGGYISTARKLVRADAWSAWTKASPATTSLRPARCKSSRLRASPASRQCRGRQ